MDSDRQRNILRAYGVLAGEAEDWGGRLVLLCGGGCVSRGAAVAVSIAGGATLAIDSDAAAMKAAMRSGELDFVVNTLDEALRTLKNEVRQRKPLSVGLVADVDSGLEEMVERGVLPDLWLIGLDQATRTVRQQRTLEALRASGMAVRAVGAEGKPAREVYLPSASAVERRTLDERLLGMLPVDDLVRRRWLQRLPSYLRETPAEGRWMWLSDEERTQLDL